MSVTLILIHGAIYSGLFTAALLIMTLKNPRLLLQDYPKEIVRLVPPKTKEEKRLSKIYSVPFFVIVFIAYPTFSGWHYASKNGWSFWDTMKFVWGIMQFLNVYDLLIIDWLIVCAITPRFIVLPGTEGNKGYKNYYFHFIGFLKGLIITLIISLIISLLIQIIIK